LTFDERVVLHRVVNLFVLLTNSLKPCCFKVNGFAEADNAKVDGFVPLAPNINFRIQGYLADKKQPPPPGATTGP